MNKFRGNNIELLNGYQVYSDTKQKISESYKNVACGYCNLHYTKEGHDGCLGVLPNVMNACCGHGEERLAYVQFDHSDYKNNPNRFRISGKKAVDFQNKHKK